MASTDVPTMPVNGNYAPHQGFGSIDHPQTNYAYSTNSAIPPLAASQAAAAPSAAPAPSNQQADIPKDEVGWYFVEQYYTTLSRSPEKLYLFYNKRSQFVSGQETDKVQVCVGQRAINDRIKELDFHDCKVRVTNVDSQASDSNIVIQVVGEISNKSQPHKKFTQTFVLATQTNGYFVLNDIFRYLIEEEDDHEQQQQPQQQEEGQQPVAGVESGYQGPAQTATAPESKSLTSSTDQQAVEHDAQQVDKELETKVLKEQQPPKAEQPAGAAVNGVAPLEREAPSTEEKVSESEQTPAAAPEAETQSVEAEKPKAPEPTPRASPPKQAPAQPAAASKPSLPKTWASLAASANKVVTPVTPASSAASASQPRPAASTNKSTTSSADPIATPPSSTPTGSADTPAQNEDAPVSAATQDEWTAVGGSHNRQQSRQAPEQEGSLNRGYIKAVHDGVDFNDMKSHLEKFGELAYFDISRQKNCAFIDFKTPDGYKAAVAANPHKIGSDEFNVEERRLRPGGFVPRGQFQGGRGRGGVGQGPPRGGFQGGRGGNNYGPRGARGGGASAPRGRGGAQAA